MIEATSTGSRWAVRFSNGTHGAVADTTRDKGGEGAGFRPHELLEAALASCMNMTASMFAKEKGLALDEVVTTVKLDRSKKGHASFGYSVRLVGKLTPLEKKEILAKIQECPVRTTLSAEIVFLSLEDNA
jgi:putative redox protein